jgi:hypothetical protein
MIYEPIEVFRKQAGLTPSLDTHENDTSQCVLINFDKGENVGGYISVRLEDGFAYLECFNVHGDIFFEHSIHISNFSPIEGDDNE